MSTAKHERPVDALGPDGRDPSLGEGIGPGSPERGEDDLDAVACQHRVEAGGVLRVAVPYEEPEGSVSGEVEAEVPPLLGDPDGVRVPRPVAASRPWHSDGGSTSCGPTRGATAGASAGSPRTTTTASEAEPG